ncbi:hypothetical protein AAG570_008210 [Ranatra chinensis]|uniref:GDP/GTP exchange factor Sec2 N-terminal domain-containing protein n=1 Tax=Ranatra chinensis TaxID=642074 RepID=A0ABD0Y5U9_9HEMI
MREHEGDEEGGVESPGPDPFGWASDQPPPEEDRPQDTDDQESRATADSGLDSWDRSVKEHALAKLQEELNRAHQELRIRDREVSRLTTIRKEVEAELEELTACLFQEAHNMVREANVGQAAAEKSLKECLMQIDVLTAEVSALKTLVLTSTPSRPNPHLHPQLEKDDSSGFFKKHRRSPSHFNLKYGRESSPPTSPTKDEDKPSAEIIENSEFALEVDPVVYKEFLVWRQSPTLDKSNAFISRIYREDIDGCLQFSNKELSDKVRFAVETGDIFIEAVNDKAKNNFPKKCALFETNRLCHYRLRVGDSNTWYSISHICRNRVSVFCLYYLFLMQGREGENKDIVLLCYNNLVILL